MGIIVYRGSDAAFHAYLRLMDKEIRCGPGRESVSCKFRHRNNHHIPGNGHYYHDISVEKITF